jgi:hypothetical protein
LAKGKQKLKQKKVVAKVSAAPATSKGGPTIMPPLATKKK